MSKEREALEKVWKEAYKSLLEPLVHWYGRKNDMGYELIRAHAESHIAEIADTFEQARATVQAEPAVSAEVVGALRKCYVELQHCETQIRNERKDYRSRDEMWEQPGAVYDALRAAKAALSALPTVSAAKPNGLNDNDIAQILYGTHQCQPMPGWDYLSEDQKKYWEEKAKSIRFWVTALTEAAAKPTMSEDALRYISNKHEYKDLGLPFITGLVREYLAIAAGFPAQGGSNA